jgi:hypothetical protein
MSEHQPWSKGQLDRAQGDSGCKNLGTTHTAHCLLTWKPRLPIFIFLSAFRTVGSPPPAYHFPISHYLIYIVCPYGITIQAEQFNLTNVYGPEYK